MNWLAARRASIGYFFLSYISIFLLSVFLNVGADFRVTSDGVLARSLISSLILWYALYLTSFNRILYGMMLTILALLLTLKIYYAHVLGVHIEPAVFEGMFDTSPEEVARLGSLKPVAILLAMLLFLMVGVEFGWLKAREFRHRVAWHFVKWLIVLIVLGSYSFATGRLSAVELERLAEQAFPVNFLKQFTIAAKARYRLYVANKEKVDIASKYPFSLDGKAPLMVVFVRAESLRSRSFPLVEGRRDVGNMLPDIGRMVVLPNIFSYDNYTQAAVPWMLSRSVDDRLLNEKSFISVLRKLGFDTTWLGCDNSNIAGFATPIVNYSMEADRSLFVGKLEDWIKQQPQGIIRRLVGPHGGSDARQFGYLLYNLGDKDEKRQFFWVEMNGSHVPWRGFSEAYIYAQPLCDKSLDEVYSCSQEEASNSYNSTVLFAQHLLRRLIEKLKDRNAIVFFASDHGESTGEDGLYGHGFMLPSGARRIRDQINPAFMVWASDRFVASHPEVMETLQAHSGSYARHDVIFHSVLDVLGVDSPIIDRKKSLFSPSFVARPPFVEYRYKSKNGKVFIADYNKIEFGFMGSDAVPGEVAELGIDLPGDDRLVEIELSDRYSNEKFPGRITYELKQSEKVIASGDIVEKNDDPGKRVVVDLSRSHHLVFRLIASKKVEKGWAWGAAAKTTIKFHEVDSSRRAE